MVRDQHFGPFLERQLAKIPQILIVFGVFWPRILQHATLDRNSGLKAARTLPEAESALISGTPGAQAYEGLGGGGEGHHDKS